MRGANRLRLTCLSLLVVLGGMLATSVARAEMTSLTVAASIRDIEPDTVMIQVNRRRVRVPRSLIKESSIKVGDAVLVTFRGNQIYYLFPTAQADSETSRDPASEKQH